VVAAAVCLFWLAGLTAGMAVFSGFPRAAIQTRSSPGDLARAGVLRPETVADRLAADTRVRLATVDFRRHPALCRAATSVRTGSAGEKQIQLRTAAQADAQQIFDVRAVAVCAAPASTVSRRPARPA
jgi:hypothetical protein